MAKADAVSTATEVASVTYLVTTHTHTYTHTVGIIFLNFIVTLLNILPQFKKKNKDKMFLTVYFLNTWPT